MSASFIKHFDAIVDPSIELCKKHNLLDILLLGISAVISGYEGWEDIEYFGQLNLIGCAVTALLKLVYQGMTQLLE